VQTLTPGDPDAVGSRVRYLLKGRLPMRLAFEATITRVDPPRELELQAEGDLAGTGRWELQQQEEITTVRYLWDVQTTRPWMNLVAPIARPLFTWNSRGVMLQAGRGAGGWGGRPWPRQAAGCWSAGVERFDSTGRVRPQPPDCARSARARPAAQRSVWRPHLDGAVADVDPASGC
jgi:hypothetical protein